MRFVALMLAMAILGAGLGLVSVAPVQAHGGDGGGAIQVMPGFASCPVVVAELNEAIPSTTSCTDLLEGGGR
jgi:hypothetical protein